jgi:hypothetical protein
VTELERKVRAEVGSYGPLADSGLGACAIDLAVRLADEDLRPAAAAMLHAQLGARLADLRKLAPPAVTTDEIDEVAAQRQARRAAAGLA